MSKSAEVLAETLDAIRAVTGLDFRGYRSGALLAALARHAGTEPLDQLPRRLRVDSRRARALADEFLVPVTGFFRNQEVFDSIEHRIVPALLDGRPGTDAVRAWCAGCASGEEAYSLAMTLLDAVDRAGRPHRVQVFATDIHARSLAIARDGIYGAEVAAEVSPDRLARFFEQVPGGYRARERLRDAITFARHDITADVPFTRIDLITCRNVLMYFERALQEQVAELLHCALTRDGVLVLGPYEALARSGLVRFDPAFPLYRNAATSECAARLPALRRRPAPPNLRALAGTLREELICADEQLYTLLDELCVAKQELASVAQELRLVNADRWERVDDQMHDIAALLDNSHIAMLLLDREMRILHFTPRAQALFNVRRGDRGRPLSDLTHQLAASVIDEIRGVCATGTSVENEVQDATGRRYLMRAHATPRPGAVITLVDITSLYRLDLLPPAVQSLYRMSPDWRFMQQLDGQGLLVDTVESRADWMDIYIDPADRALVRSAIEHSVRTSTVFELAHRVVTASGDLVWIRSRALPIFDAGGQVREWYGVASRTPQIGRAA